MHMRVFSGVCVVGLSIAAIAGIPCPDPFSYKIVHGSCVPAPDLQGGYIVANYSYTPGGCKTPGTSAYSCEVKSIVTTAERKKGETFMRFTWADIPVYFSCVDDTPIAIVGARYGQSNLTKPCDYCTGT